MRLRHLSAPASEVAAILDDDDSWPSEKRAAVALVELRTKLEVRTLFLRVSLSLNTALLTGLIVKLFLQ